MFLRTFCRFVRLPHQKHPKKGVERRMTEISPETIELCQRSDAAAFAQVVQRYERPLFAYVYRLGCTPSDRDAEDVVQEIFVKVYQNIHRYRRLGKGVFSTCLFAIAHNHCMSLGRRKQIETQTRRGETSRSPVPSETPHPSPAETLSDREEVARDRASRRGAAREPSGRLCPALLSGSPLRRDRHHFELQ